MTFNIRTISVIMAFDGVTFLRRITPHHYDIQQYGNQRYFKDWHSSRTALTRIAFNITAFRMTFNRMLLSRTTPSILTFRKKALRIPIKDSENWATERFDKDHSATCHSAECRSSECCGALSSFHRFHLWIGHLIICQWRVNKVSPSHNFIKLFFFVTYWQNNIIKEFLTQ